MQDMHMQPMAEYCAWKTESFPELIDTLPSDYSFTSLYYFALIAGLLYHFGYLLCSRQKALVQKA